MPAMPDPAELDELQEPAYLEAPVRTNRAELILVLLLLAGLLLICCSVAFASLTSGAMGAGLMAVALLVGAARRSIHVGGLWGIQHADRIYRIKDR